MGLWVWHYKQEVLGRVYQQWHCVAMYIMHKLCMHVHVHVIDMTCTKSMHLLFVLLSMTQCQLGILLRKVSPSALYTVQ